MVDLGFRPRRIYAHTVYHGMTVANVRHHLANARTLLRQTLPVYANTTHAGYLSALF